MLDRFIDSQEISDENIKKLNQIASEIKLVSVSSKLKELKIDEQNKLEWLNNNAYRICRSTASESVFKLVEEKKNDYKFNNFFVASKNNENIYFVKSNYENTSKKPRVQLIFAEDNLSQHPGDIWYDIKTTGLDNEGAVPFKNGKKPIKLLDRLINSVSKNELEPFIILDFFSGSASTAEAVMRNNYINSKHNNFILVQISENLDENYIKATGDTKKSIKNSIDFLDNIKKPHFVTELGKERIRRAGEKIKEEIEITNAQLKFGEEPKQVPDIGFKVFRTDDTNINWNLSKELGQINFNNAAYSPDTIDFVMGTNDIDVVYEIMLRQKDVALSESLEVLTDIGDRTYLYASSYLVCLETEITEEMIDKLASLEPLPIKFVFRDSAFGDDIDFKDYTFRKLNTLIEKNSGETKKTYTVEFI